MQKNYVIGELKDPKMLAEILDALMKKGIRATSQFDAEKEHYIIYVSDSESVLLAHDLFRVKMGFKKPQEIDQEWVKIKSLPRGEYTYYMMLFSGFLYVLSFSRLGEQLYSALMIGRVDSSLFYEVFHGQLWRLFTPIFLHMSFMHILFNMLWFKDLGNLIEHSFGKKFLLIFVLGTGLFSNLCQYLVQGPQFGGMSGVLYAMLGFIWVYNKLNSTFPHSIPKYDLGIMIGWYFLCLTGMLGPIANTAHGSGLVIGMVIASVMNFKAEKVRFKFLLLASFFLIFTLMTEGYKLGGRFYLLLWMNNG